MDATLSRHGGPARIALILACLAGAVLLTGCRWWPRRQVEIPTYSEMLSKDELVGTLNANIEPLAAWRCTDAKVKTRGNVMGIVELGAHVAVERPRNFRLIAKLLSKNMADLGSNDERFWFWFDGHPQRKTFTARHEHTDYAQRVLQVPFEPDWLLEALGVVPLNADDFFMQPDDQGTGVVSLHSERMTSGGRIVRRVILVDARHRIIVAHALFDTAGHLIARATLSNHHSDAATGLVLPHRIDLEWPQADLAMTMTLGQIEINPPHVPATWAMPTIPQYPAYEIAAPSMPDHLARPAPVPYHAGPAEQFGEAAIRDEAGWSDRHLQPPEEPARFDEWPEPGQPSSFVPEGARRSFPSPLDQAVR